MWRLWVTQLSPQSSTRMTDLAFTSRRAPRSLHRREGEPRGRGASGRGGRSRLPDDELDREHLRPRGRDGVPGPRPRTRPGPRAHPGYRPGNYPGTGLRVGQAVEEELDPGPG